MAYLDDTGLAYFWGKIKAWANSVFALISHTHPASDVTLMTGYSKPASGSAIAASDSLNQAVGKLEAKADGMDGLFVHLSGNDEISGQKVFNQPSLILKDTLVDADDYPSSGASYTELFFVGNDHVLGTPFDNDPSRLGEIQYYKSSTGGRGLEMTVRWHENSGGSANIGLARNSSGAVFGYCPSTPLPSVHNTGTDIVTRDFIPNDTRIVHTTGDEDILGCKSFDVLWVWNDSIDFLNLVNTGNDNEYLHFVDTNHSAYASIQTSTRVDMNRMCFRLRKLGDTAGDMSSAPSIGITCNSTYPDGYGFCPTISNLAEDSNVIATTAWVRDATGNTALNAATATKLATARQLKVALGSTGTATFDGSANQNSIPVSGTLAVGNGGTGLTSLDSFVRTTGTQAIGGYKYFTSGSTGIYNLDVDYTKTQSATSNSYLYFNDKNGVTMSCLQNHVTTTDNRLRLMIRKQKDTATATSNLHSLQLIYGNDDTLTFECSGNGLWSLGSSGAGRWKDVWAANATIQTSDSRLKTNVEPLPDAVLDAWENVSFVQFRMRDSVSKKGSAARLHSGAVAQDIGGVFASAGLDASVYGFFCHDAWGYRPAEYDQDGNLDEPAREAGDEYSLRYVELLCIEAAYQRRRADRAEARLAALEDRLAALELRLGSE